MRRLRSSLRASVPRFLYASLSSLHTEHLVSPFGNWSVCSLYDQWLQPGHTHWTSVIAPSSLAVCPAAALMNKMCASSLSIVLPSP